jgi:orotidine-5'-phosphate decarboxylase
MILEDAPARAAARLCIALDSVDAAANERVADLTRERADMFKLGLTSFSSGGPELARRIAARRPLFLDLKLHDIPAQVAGAIEAIGALDVTLTTVHAAGGPEMLAAAVAAAPPGLGVAAVTVLTSLDPPGLARTGVARSLGDHVTALADDAVVSGVAGLVCSPHEAAGLRARFGPVAGGGPLLVVPGIRPRGGDQHDQRRSADARAAAAAGADVVVVGRAVTGAADPVAAADALADELR